VTVFSALALVKLWAAEGNLVVSAGFWHVFLVDAPESNIVVHVDDVVDWATIESSDLESSWLGAHVVSSHFPVSRVEVVVVVVPFSPVVASWAIAGGEDWAADLDGEVLALTAVLLAVDTPETDVKVGVDGPCSEASIDGLSTETSWVGADSVGIEAREDFEVTLGISCIDREPARPGVAVLSARAVFDGVVAVDCWVRIGVSEALAILVLGVVIAVGIDAEVVVAAFADWAVSGFEAPLVVGAPLLLGSLTSHGLVSWAAEGDFEVSAWHTAWLLFVQAVEAFKSKVSDLIGGSIVASLGISDLGAHGVEASLVGFEVVEHFPVTSSSGVVDVVVWSPFPSFDVASSNLHLRAAVSDLEVSALTSALLVVETVETNGGIDVSVLDRSIIGSLSLSGNGGSASFFAREFGERFVVTSSSCVVVVEPVGPFIAVLVAFSVNKRLFTAESDFHVDTFVFATSGGVELLIIVTSVSIEVEMLDEVQ